MAVDRGLLLQGLRLIELLRQLCFQIDIRLCGSTSLHQRVLGPRELRSLYSTNVSLTILSEVLFLSQAVARAIDQGGRAV